VPGADAREGCTLGTVIAGPCLGECLSINASASARILNPLATAPGNPRVAASYLSLRVRCKNGRLLQGFKYTNCMTFGHRIEGLCHCLFR
jgi:hypothetical protein